MTVLYVNDTLVDLPDGVVFATNLSKVEIGDLATRKVNYTNSVKLPHTPTNRVVFGFAENEKSYTLKPYRKFPARLIQNGVEIISEGVCWLVSVDESFFTIAVYEKAFNIFSVIKGKKLNRLSHIADSAWNASDIDTARTSTTGLVSAVIDWGRNGGASIYNSAYFLPSFYYHDFVKQILQQTDLTLSGSVLTNQHFLDLVVPYGLPKFEYPSNVNEDYIFSVAKDSISKNITIAADAGSPSTDVIELDYDTFSPPTIYQGNARIFDTSTFTATVPDTGANNAWLVAVLSGRIYINVNSWNPGDIGRFTIRVRDKNGFVVDSQTTDFDYTTFGAAPVIGLSLVLASLTTSLSDGDQIDLTVGTFVGSGSGAIDISVRRNTSSPFNNLKLSTISGTVSVSDVKWQLLLPDVLQSDLIKDFFVRFGVIPKQDGGTLVLKTIKEITDDRSGSIDWTNKRTEDPDLINYSPSTYAQANVFSYSDDSGAGIEPDKNSGIGALYTNNEILPGSRTVYNTFFEVCNDDTIFSVNAALVRVYDSTSAAISDFNNEPGLRLLTLRAKEAGEPTITFNAIARSDYKVANFLYPTGTKDTGWPYFLTTYYGQAFLDAIENLRIITRKYALNELDIANYDPHKMIYDNGSYYLLNRIIDYVPGRVTKVELLKI